MCRVSHSTHALNSLSFCQTCNWCEWVRWSLVTITPLVVICTQCFGALKWVSTADSDSVWEQNLPEERVWCDEQRDERWLSFRGLFHKMCLFKISNRRLSCLCLFLAVFVYLKRGVQLWKFLLFPYTTQLVEFPFCNTAWKMLSSIYCIQKDTVRWRRSRI